MISRIIRHLHEDGVLPSGDAGDYSWFMSARSGASFVLHDARDGRPLLFVKISDRRPLKTVFERMRLVRAVAPDVVPEPLSLITFGEFSALVVRAYDICPLKSCPSRTWRAQGGMLRRILEELVVLHTRTREGASEFNREFVEEVLEPEIGYAFQASLTEGLRDALLTHVRGLQRHYGLMIQRVPQHGDMVLGNLALVRGRENGLMILDWDDYAEVKLSVLDLMTLIRSYVGFRHAGMFDSRGSSTYVSELLQSYCRKMEINAALAVDLYPICLLVYARLRASSGIGGPGAYDRVTSEIEKFLSGRSTFILRPGLVPALT